MSNILLSICIPTFNRSEYLERVILSIVGQRRFLETNEVEIVISDNCSEDDTNEIVRKFIAIFNNKIRYYRNIENIVDANFEKVLSYGKGDYLKLNNDTLLHRENSLDVIIAKIQENVSNKDILFFGNGLLKSRPNMACKDVDEFITKVSFYSTWIGGFGIWKDQLESFNDFNKNIKLKLVQTDVLLTLISSGNSVCLINTNIFDSIVPESKGGYNLYKVFVTNYLGLLKVYRGNKEISSYTLFNEKSKLLKHYLLPWSINVMIDKDKYKFDQSGALQIVFKEYRFHPIFYIGMLYLVFRLMKYYLQKRACQLTQFICI